MACIATALSSADLGGESGPPTMPAGETTPAVTSGFAEGREIAGRTGTATGEAEVEGEGGVGMTPTRPADALAAMEAFFLPTGERSAARVSG